MDIATDIWEQFEAEIKNKIQERIKEEQSNKNQDLQKDLIKVRSKLKILADSLNTMIFDIHSILDNYDLGGEKLESKLKLYDPVCNANSIERQKYRNELLKGLRELLSNDEIEQVLKLRSNHAIRIYELLRRYKDGFAVGFQEIRKILSLKEESYRSFSAFRSHILESAKNEINNKTSLTFKFKVNYPEADSGDEEEIEFWTV